MPSYKLIRERIDAIGNTVHIIDNPFVPKTADDLQYKMALRFQLLAAARISEVCGPYLFRRDDLFEVDFPEGQGMLMIVRTAKRKGKPRPCAIPLNPIYEPWAQELMEYIQEGPEYPFKFHDNLTGTSKRYLMWAARLVFDGLYWPMAEYTRTIEVPYVKDQVIKERYSDLMYPEYLVELEPGKRVWTTSTEFAPDQIKIYGRWKPVTSHVMRKRRSKTLSQDYHFDGTDLAYIGGWTEKSQSSDMPDALKFYLHADIQDIKENVGLLKQMARRYFAKLQVPLSEIEKPF